MTKQTHGRRVLATAFLSLLAMNGAARSNDQYEKLVVVQAHGAALDVGSKHIVSYFTAQQGVCNVTLLIGNKANSEGEGASIGTRVKFNVPAGMTARTDTAEGKSLEFACRSGASTMSIQPLDLLAYSGPAK